MQCYWLPLEQNRFDCTQRKGEPTYSDYTRGRHSSHSGLTAPLCDEFFKLTRLIHAVRRDITLPLQFRISIVV